MPAQLATLAQASVLQLRDALRRVTSLHAHAARERDEQAFLVGVEISGSAWAERAETNFDIRDIHA
ncbi:MAG: hypothetical protein JF607_10290 [Burkholderiales bacterium]|jgi:hypothetical protein|nr:hypothetical protein [Burkholderiales bacterium]